MRFHLHHVTRYEFSGDVLLDPHLLRFQPRYTGDQTLVSYQLQIHPRPEGRTEHIDAEGNAVTRVWFEEPANTLELVSDSIVLCHRSNPFDFLLTPENRALPLHYLARIDRLLEPARCRDAATEEDDPVQAWAQQLADEANHETVPTLLAMAEGIQSRCQSRRRETGRARSPAETLQLGVGACRDFAWLYVDACRSLNIPARFVSGYQEAAQEQGKFDLHAWAEVYLPGAGWRGFDPSTGLAVADRHVAIAASVSPAGASCVDGTFRGDGVQSELSHHIELRVEPRTESEMVEPQ